MIELMHAGIVQVMPGLAVADVLPLAWNRECQGRDKSHRIFGKEKNVCK